MLCINALPYAGMIQIRFSGSSAGAAAGRAGTLSAGVHRLPEQGDTFARHWLSVNFFKGRTPGAPCNGATGDKLVPSLKHEPGRPASRVASKRSSRALSARYRDRI